MNLKQLSSKLDPAMFTAVIDTREQYPLTLGMPVEAGTLQTGDYSVKGMTDIIAVERKSLSDLVACMGKERSRFEHELQRLRAYPI